MNPLAPDFWEQYQKFMDNTMKSTQKLVSELSIQPNSLAPGNIVSTSSSPGWQGEKNQEIKLEDTFVVVSLGTSGLLIDNSNTRITLEGYRLQVEGALKAQVSLPVAVKKYGGKAISKKNLLEIILVRDKFNTPTQILIEKET